MKLTPKQSAMAPRALAFIRDDFARQDAAEVRHWGKHLHGGAGVSNVAVAEHLGTGRKDTLSLLDKLVGAGLLAQVSEHTGTTEQRRGWAGGGARNFHKEHWNYNAVTYTVRSYRVTLLGEEWLAAQVRSNPAERMTTTEALDALRDATTGEEVEAIADAYAANEKHRHWSDQDNATIIDRHAGIWYLTPPREDDNGVMQEARRSCRDKGAPSINLGREYMLPPMSVERTIRLRNLLIQSAIDRERVRSNPATPAPMEVQSILFDRELWTPPRAEAWLRRHDYAGLDVDVKPNTLRYRQHDPDLFRPRSFRTVAFGEETGIQAVVGKRKRGASRANAGGRVEQPDCWSSGGREILSPAEADRGHWRCPRCGRVLKVRVRQGRDGAASEATIPKHKPTPGSAEYRSNPKKVYAYGEEPPPQDVTPRELAKVGIKIIRVFSHSPYPKSGNAWRATMVYRWNVYHHGRLIGTVTSLKGAKELAEMELADP